MADEIISIHALLAESDNTRCREIFGHYEFLSTLSLRRATPHRIRLEMACRISIHALLAESDILRYDYLHSGLCISIHALLAESDSAHFYTVPAVLEFLSTLSLRRATDVIGHTCNISAFLSTLSLRRATFGFLLFFLLTGYFYPRSPCGERRIKPIFSKINTRDFYPRSPCGERR